jgi:hypothetical protein
MLHKQYGNVGLENKQPQILSLFPKIIYKNALQYFEKYYILREKPCFRK